MATSKLGDRMKEYESVPKLFLTRRIPAIIRLDGKAFHTFTEGMSRPFDSIMVETMQKTMQYLCENIQGCVLGYTQSDEITLVLTDYKTIATDAWFGYNVQKMVSVSASMATLAFNRFFREAVEKLDQEQFEAWNVSKGEQEYVERMMEKFDKAMFDARVFSLPKEEVCNCLIWRQQDATRNSIQAVGQKHFTQNQLYGKSCDEIQDMLFTQKGVNWNDFSTSCKRGSCCKKERWESEWISSKGKLEHYVRNGWVIDKNIPIFTQKREYVENLL